MATDGDRTIDPNIPAGGGGAGAHPSVLFADIAGSTKLYEALGDVEAKRLIDDALIALTALTKRHGGRVVKTIGDEVMCVFANAEKSFHAATDMQNKIDSMPVVSGTKRRIRIGFHAGPLIEENGDVFGDTVNVAARMSGLAKGMQIMTTRSTVDKLPGYLRGFTRDIAALSVKGKADDMAVCEVLWQDEGDLTMTVAALSVHAVATGELVLTHGSDEVTLNTKRNSAAMGRDPGSDIVVTDTKASRHHARIEKRRDKFFLADQSTNGTFVKFNGEVEIGLRREEIMLRGSGRILFGHSEAEGAGETVEFTVRA
jgi:adenylate cyclase